jgi:ABC-2 type transport system ATP-binding protein
MILDPVVVKNVSKWYPDRSYKPKGFERIKNWFKPKKRLVLDRVDLKVRRGEIYGLLGPNGAGKTTLLKIITGLLHPDMGSVFVLGQPMPKNQKNVAQQINAVFARANMWWQLTGRENLLVYGRIYRTPKLNHKVEKLLNFFEITKKADNYLDLCSTGEVMRLNLARALLNDPELLILDEPTIGLDPSISLKVREFIKKLNKDVGTTILLSTHYMEEADMLCDRVAIIHLGRIIRVDSPERLKEGLRGSEILEVKVSNISAELLRKINELEFVEKASFIGEEQRIRIIIRDLDYTDKALRRIKKFANIKNIITCQPTLHDVFIHLTGKELER